MRIALSSGWLSLLVLATPAFAVDDGVLDTTFASPQGKTRYAFDLGSTDDDQGDHPTRIALQSDGSVLLVGSVDQGLGQLVIGMARALKSGALDGTFNGDGDNNGKVTFGYLDSVIPSGVALQPDGKIIIAMNSTNGLALMNRRAINGDRADFPAGAASLGFVQYLIPGSQTTSIAALAPLADGKFLAAGTVYTSAVTGDDFFVARFNSDGSLDTGFGTSSGHTRIGFNIDATRSDQARALAVARDGRIAVLGTVSAVDHDFGVAVLQANGVPDPIFSGDGKTLVEFDVGTVSDDRAAGACFSPGGRLLVGGTISDSQFGDIGGLALLSANGDLDGGFGNNGRHSYAAGDATRFTDVACASDGKFVAIGTVDTTSVSLAPTEAVIVWFRSDGSGDPDFGSFGSTLFLGLNPSGGREDKGVALQMTSDGRAYALFDTQYAGADYDFGLARYTAPRLFANGFDIIP